MESAVPQCRVAAIPEFVSYSCNFLIFIFPSVTFALAVDALIQLYSKHIFFFS